MSTTSPGAFRRAWRKSGLSASKVIATALAAIAMALIAPRITGLTSSLIAVGLISVVSAVLNAFLSSAAEATADSAKRLAAVVPGVAGARAADHGSEPDRGEVAWVEAGADVEAGAEVEAKVDPEAESGADEAAGTAGTAGTDGTDAGTESVWMVRLRRVFHSNYIYLVLFAVIAVVTIGVTWAIADATGDTTLIRSSTVQVISEEQRQSIVDDAAADAARALKQGDVPAGLTADGSPVTLDQLVLTNEELRLRLDQLESAEETDDADLLAQIDALTARIAELEARLAEAGIATPVPTATPTPTPTPTPGVTPSPGSDAPTPS